MNSLGHSDAERWSWVPGATIIVLVVFLVFGQIVSHQFLNWDDNVNVWNNRKLNPVTVNGVAYFWGNSYARMYAPMAYTFYAVEGLISPRAEAPPGKPFGPFEPTVFHIGSLLLHAGCCVLVLLILRRLIHHEAAALAGALLFALHPLQVETVAWVTETRGLLAALFGLTALWQYLQFADESIDDSRRRAVHYLVASLALLLALLSKPSAVAIPLMALVLDWGWYRRPLQQVVVAIAPWVLLAAVFALATALVQQGAPIETGPLWARPLLALDALAHYIVKFLWPYPLGPDYGHTPSAAMQKNMWYAMGVLPLGLAYLAWSMPDRRVWLTALGTFTVALLPLLGLVSFDFQQNSTVADRYVYLAMLGPAMALAWFLVRYGSVLRYGVVAVVLIGLGTLSFFQAAHWENDIELAEQALLVNPDSYTFQLNAGNALYRAGVFDKAIERYKRARELRADSDLARYELIPLYYMARAEFQLGNMPGAIENAELVLAERPEFAGGDVYVLLGQALLRIERNAEAREAFEKALAINPNSDGALNGLAMLDSIEAAR